MEYLNRGVWDDVRGRLLSEPYNCKQHGDHLREGRCPQCSKKTLWTPHAAEPARVWCDRENNCGYTATAKELFPDLFDAARVLRDHPITPENPNAGADAWMQHIRGLDISPIKNWYSQHSYAYRPKEAIEQNLPAERVEAIRFQLPGPMQGAWDRFMDGEHFGKKTYLHAGAKLNGWLWTPPDQTLMEGEELLITEGIFDALALRQAGCAVAALMGATNKPLEFIKEHRALRLHYVVALDNDTAGQTNALKLYKWLREQGEQAACIQPAADSRQKCDWNDLLKQNKLSVNDFKNYRYYGDLLTAPSAEKRGQLMYARTGTQFFIFEHANNTYIWSFDPDKNNKIEEQIRVENELESEDVLSSDEEEEIIRRSGAVSLLANCALDFLYTQRNPITDELFYFFRVRHADGRETLNTVTGAQLASAADFRKRLLSMAGGALIRADHAAHEWMTKKWMGNIRVVDVVGFAGYSELHNAYIYPDFAVFKGKYIKKNHEDYLELTPKIHAKSAYHSVDIRANPDFKDYNDEWLGDLYTAWGTKGIIALAFFTLSLFAEQVRGLNKSLTFLELVGDPGTGKTTLIEFLWKLFGRDNFEGFDPSSSNPAYVARALNQVSNLPVVMIEGDRGQRNANHRAKFDWSETKKLYNGRAMKGRGMRTQGNETYEPPFRGSLIISQNAPVDAEQAVLERIVHIFFRKSDTSAATLAAVKRLVRIPTEQLSGYLIKCLTQADTLLKTYTEAQAEYESRFRQLPAQKTYRLALNHSQIAAALHMLSHVTAITPEILNQCINEVGTMSLRRETAIALDHPDVEQFFEMLEYLEEKGVRINHSDDPKTLAINLNQCYELGMQHHQQLQHQVLLKPLLRNSHRYTDTRAYHSVITKKTIRCWLFSR